jgi:hypothetical protein
LERQSDVQAGARIESGTESLRQRGTSKGSRLGQGAVSTEERQAIAGCRSQFFADIGERHSFGKLPVEHVPRDDSA